MILPSAVLFFSSCDFSDNCLCNGVLGFEGFEPGGKGEGREDAEVLAGALRKPRGSLRVVLDMRRIEPEKVSSQCVANPVKDRHMLDQVS